MTNSYEKQIVLRGNKNTEDNRAAMDSHLKQFDRILRRNMKKNDNLAAVYSTSVKGRSIRKGKYHK